MRTAFSFVLAASYYYGLALLAMAPFFVYADHTTIHTIELLQQQVVQLQQQITARQAQISGGGSSSSPSDKCQFSRNITLGSKGEDIRCLQQYLTREGHFNYIDGATSYFGSVTRAAVISWQSKHGISPAAGYFGPLSRARYGSIVSSVPSTQPSTNLLSPPVPILENTNAAITVVAANGLFTPSSIEVKHLENAMLSIFASDRDYLFRIKEGGIDFTITRGTTVLVDIGGLGVGNYTFDCGSGCNGTVTVVGKADED